MDPDDEQMIIAEAIYLHSLWHRGPPRSSFHHPQPPPLIYPIPTPPTHLLHLPLNPTRPRSSFHHPQPPPLIYPIPTPPTHLLHLPLNPTRFKKKKKQIKKKLPAPDKEWPCNPSSGEPPASSLDWNRAWPKLNSEPISLSDQEICRAGSIQAQSKALKVTTAYFFDSDDDDESESESERDDLEEYDFFVNLFEEDKILSEYYSKSYQNGEFVCLVCGGLGKKLAGKKYKGCLPLVQHSIAIGNTKKKKAHRAFAQAICKVLSWNIDDLSTVASEMATSRNINGGNGMDALETMMTDGAAQEVGDEGGMDVLTDATVLGQSEVCDGKDKLEVEENVGKETNNNSSIGDTLPAQGCSSGGTFENNGESMLLEENVAKETNDSSCIGDALPVQECSSVGSFENNGGSMLLEQKSGTEAAVPEIADVVDSTDPVVVVDGETETSNHSVESSKDGCIASTDEVENGGLQADRPGNFIGD